MSLKIYTKTGDKGNTSLIGGTKVLKSNIRIEAYGTIDELNSFIGLVADHCREMGLPTCLSEIQERLFTVGSSLACDPEKEPGMKLPDLKDSDISHLEHEIDRMSNELPVMKFFIMPSGHIAVSTTHIARCVCRRAERCCVLMQEQNLFVDSIVIKYLNRLSDYLFILARYIGHQLGVPEIPWKPRL